MNPLRSKLPQAGTTIFAVMSAMANRHDAINLSQGFPDYDPDVRLLDLVSQHIHNGKNQYAPMPGLPQLREQIAQLVARKYGFSYHTDDEVTVTSGGTEALFCAIAALVHTGDEVLIVEPAYDSYAPAVELNGGVVLRSKLQSPGYNIDWEEINALVSDKTRLLILNSPHNPSGSIIGEEDIRQLKELASRFPFYILSDEVYEHMVYDGETHWSMARVPELRERSLIVSSFGKSLHATGWKMGYCLAPAFLTTELRKAHQFVNFSTSSPFQFAIADYLAERPAGMEALAPFYQQKRDLFLSLTADTGFQPVHCAGTYFQLMDYRQISDLGDMEFSEWLTREIGVACIPVSAFYGDKTDVGVVRFCFAKRDDTLEAAAVRLRRI